MWVVHGGYVVRIRHKQLNSLENRHITNPYRIHIGADTSDMARRLATLDGEALERVLITALISEPVTTASHRFRAPEMALIRGAIVKTNMEANQKRRGNPNMQKGSPSLNPGGRPKLGHALAEQVRALVEPTEIAEFLVSVMKGPHWRIADRMQAARELLDRGWGKAIVTSEIDATVNGADNLPANLTAMSPAERMAWLATLPVPSGKS